MWRSLFLPAGVALLPTHAYTSKTLHPVGNTKRTKSRMPYNWRRKPLHGEQIPWRNPCFAADGQSSFLFAPVEVVGIISVWLGSLPHTATAFLLVTAAVFSLSARPDRIRFDTFDNSLHRINTAPFFPYRKRAFFWSCPVWKTLFPVLLKIQTEIPTPWNGAWFSETPHNLPRWRGSPAPNLGHVPARHQYTARSL